MLFGREAYNQLARPFPVDKLKFRPGNTTQDKSRGKPLTYIDQRDVIVRLNEVLGPENWGCNYRSDHERLTCTIEVKCEDGEWIEKSNGAGDTDFEGTKGGYSDALKRAAVLLGVGLYLYNVDLPWKPLEKGKYFSDKSISELQEEMKKYGEEGSEGNVVSLGKAREVQSGEGATPVRTPTVAECRSRISNFVSELDGHVGSEEELLYLIEKNLDVFAKLKERDESRQHVAHNVNWYISNGKNGDHTSARDRILSCAESFGTEALLNVIAVLEEHDV